ncbi:MAG: DUF1294 domain-containing protein [Muribaculaceae bacterium]|nr:DUF1294 domain-containing protein [Muribaculaceae bacterium]
MMNIITFCLFAWDKRKAIFSQRRIPEFVLIIFAFLGGALGAFCAMLFFRHKINKPLFMISIPILLVLQLIGYGLLFWLRVI